MFCVAHSVDMYLNNIFSGLVTLETEKKAEYPKQICLINPLSFECFH